MQTAKRQRQTTPLTFLCVLPLAFCIFAVPGLAQAPVKARLVGAWELVNYEIIAADGSRRPGAYDRGQISYDASGRMSAHLMNSANKSEQTPQTDDARAAAYRRYLGYYGPFVVDEARGTVTHIVDGSSNPSWVGSRQVRYYELSADNSQLTLSLRDANGRTTQALVWKRAR